MFSGSDPAGRGASGEELCGHSSAEGNHTVSHSVWSFPPTARFLLWLHADKTAQINQAPTTQHPQNQQIIFQIYFWSLLDGAQSRAVPPATVTGSATEPPRLSGWAGWFSADFSKTYLMKLKEWSWFWYQRDLSSNLTTSPTCWYEAWRFTHNAFCEALVSNQKQVTNAVPAALQHQTDGPSHTCSQTVKLLSEKLHS